MNHQPSDTVRVAYERNYPLAVFALNEPLLAGVVRCAVECAQETADGAPVSQSFVLDRARGERLEFDSPEKLEESGNTVENPVITLEYTCKNSLPSTRACQIVIRFDPRSEDRTVRLVVSGPSERWVEYTTTALIKHVGRALKRERMHLFAARIKAFGFLRFSLALAAIFAAMAMLLAQVPSNAASEPLLISSGQQASLRTLAMSGASDAAKIDFTYRVLAAAIADKGGPGIMARPRTYALVIPILLIVVASVILLRSYSRSFFVWGDHITRYERENLFRERLITGVLIAFSVSILSNMLTAAAGS